ncbi:MAG TPA: hypothetical protein VIQ77_15000, partial [Mucilaginibacter sp.]
MMTAAPKSFLVRWIFLISLVISAGLALNIQAAKAQDTSGLTFTSIPTTADSIAMRKKAQQAQVAKQKVAVSAPVTEKPKSLWQIFIAGFLGGLAAVVMPCIYPLL